MVGQVAVELIEHFKGILSIQKICEYLSIPRSTY